MKWALPVILILLLSGCAKPEKSNASAAPSNAPAPEELKAPHGGTAVEIGDYHVEFVRTANRGLMEAYILDDDLENFVRIQTPEFEVEATADGATEVLKFVAGADQATGETVGNTSYFTAHSPWLETHASFQGKIRHLSARGSDFDQVAFPFPGPKS